MNDTATPMQARNWLKQQFWNNKSKWCPGEPWANASGGCDTDSFILYISPIELTLFRSEAHKIGLNRMNLEKTLRNFVNNEFPHLNMEVKLEMSEGYGIAIHFNREETVPKKTSYRLTDFQRDVLVERIDDVLDDTEDWQLSDNDMSAAIQSWVDMLKTLKPSRADYWINEYKDICKVS